MAAWKECYQQAVQTFKDTFNGKTPTIRVFAPGRVNLIGEHTDYNEGCVLPMAIHLVTVIVGCPSENSDVCRVVTCSSFGPSQPSYTEFPVPTRPSEGTKLVTVEGPRWASYIKGVLALSNDRCCKIPAFDAAVATTVPLGGGLSSSAALEVATCSFVEELIRPATLGLTLQQKALLCQEAEHRYAHVPCGIMDQFVSAMAKEGHALFIDCRDQSTECVPLNSQDLVILVTNSNVHHELVNNEYGQRRSTCESVCQKLKKAFLRDVTLEELEANKGSLTELEFRRARHVVGEIRRTFDACAALKVGDYAKFGQLMNESHDSLRDDYEVSCAELDELVNLARQDKGVYGSRMTGGGFGGCTVTLLKAEAVERIKANIAENYSGKATFYTATACQGAGVIPVDNGF